MRRAEPCFPSTVVVLALCFLAHACGGGTTTEVTGGPDPVRCASDLTPTAASISADGGRTTVTVSAPRECTWSATTQAPWLEVTPGAGQGNGSVVVAAASNAYARGRTAVVTINDRQFTLTQAARACRFALRPPSVSLGSSAASASVLVDASDGCAWQASTSDAWLRIHGSDMRIGPGALEFDVTANPGAQRQAIVRIADDQELTIVQAAAGAAPVPGPPSPFGPAAPTNLAARAISDTSVELRWAVSDPAAETHVYRDGAVVAVKSVGVSSHVDSGLRPATSYSYAVRHVRNGAPGGDSNVATARPAFFATGGAVSTSGGYRQHVFASSGTFVVTQGGTIAEIIIVGGGGGGGGSEAGTDYGSGGGGGGGVRVITAKLESPGSYAVVVGQGGRGGAGASSNPANNNGFPGGASSYGPHSAAGGGGGAGAGGNYLGNQGGSGGNGGGGAGAPGGNGTPGEGNAGGAGAVNPGGSAGGGGGGSKTSPGLPATNVGGGGGPGYQTWHGPVGAGGDGGRALGEGADGTMPGGGGDGNGPGGSGGRGADGVVLIRYLH